MAVVRSPVSSFKTKWKSTLEGIRAERSEGPWERGPPTPTSCRWRISRWPIPDSVLKMWSRKRRRSWVGQTATGPLHGGAAGGLRAPDRGDRHPWSRIGLPGRLRKAVRDLFGVVPRIGPDRSRDVRRMADLSDRSLSRKGGDAEHSRSAVRQRTLRRSLEQLPYRERADRCAGDARRRDASRLLRRDRRDPRHAGDPPVPDCRRARNGATALPRTRLPGRGT